MTTQQQTERDEALIAIDEAFDMLGGISDASEARDKLLVAMRALRGDEPAKPDRYVVITREVLAARYFLGDAGLAEDIENGECDNLNWFQAAAAVLRKHFEPPSDVVEAAVDWRDNQSGAGIMARFILKGEQ